jgi:hypothetical protein
MELLIVVTIIGILAGLLFPVFGVLRQKAWDARTRNIAVQAANAWEAFRIAFRAYPADVVATLPDVRKDNDDYLFPMTRDACNLLNWYGGKHKDFAGAGSTRKSDAVLDAEWYDLLRAAFEDAPDYETKRPERVKVELASSLTESGKAYTGGGAIQVHLREKFFERNEVQWRSGLMGDKDNRVVWVKLDTNYDGVVTFTSRDAAGRTVTETVRKSVIAWGEDPSGKNPVIKAW